MISREEFQKLYDQGPDVVYEFLKTLSHQVSHLTTRVDDLEQRAKKDSSNSNKPPSSDGYKKKPVSLRPSQQRKPGGQKGHIGKTLEFSQNPNHVRDHTPDRCTCCGEELEFVPGGVTEIRQVIDLPVLPVEVTQHQRVTKSCPRCGHRNRGEFPQEVSNPLQYGSRLRGQATYFLQYQLLPYDRVQEMFADLYGLSLSKGTLFNIQRTGSTRIALVLEEIKEGLRTSQVLHLDETGMRATGSLHWIHSASTEKLTFYHISKKRGEAGTREGNILGSFFHTAVHDAWAAYWNFPCSHGLCNTHHLRELKSLYDASHQDWTQELSELLLRMNRAVKEAKVSGETSLAASALSAFFSRYDELLEKGFQVNPRAEAPSEPTRGRVKQTPGYNLLSRLKQRKEETLRFLTDFEVPFTNNQAEQDIRMVKVKQKVSGTFRSLEGGKLFCDIRSYISTARKQGHAILEALINVFAGHPLKLSLSG